MATQLGRPAITDPARLELRPLQDAIRAARQRIEALERELARVSGLAGQTAYTGGSGNSTASVAGLTALAARVTALEAFMDALLGLDNGLVVVKDGTLISRVLEAGQGITITYPDGQDGNPLFTVIPPAYAQPAPGALVLAGLAPAVVVPNLVGPGVGALALAGLAPTIGIPSLVAPGAGAAALAGLAPTLSVAGPAYRYWRLRITGWKNNGTSNAGDVRVAEWVLYTAANVDWPTSAMTSNTAPPPFAASASSQTTTWDPYAAFDHNLGDSFRWISGGSDASPYLEIDMGSAQTFTHMDLAPDGAVFVGGGYYITDFSVLGSNTGAFAGEEATVYSASGLAQGGWTANTYRTFTF